MVMPLRPLLLCFAAGVLGVLLALTAWHLYADHLLIDAARANMARPAPAARPPTPAPDPSQP